ncbi:hypothetical protein N7499_000008 [Penicillium canescens]|nr:hypothetical protein N7499_000008 [Penicillium canescens]KAJ6172841.1 hypothetical protein N7485_005653 [Penicillium canescens]
MAELRFHGRESAQFPLYLNPNIWTVVGVDPTTAPLSAPRTNSTTWIWCSVANTGSQPINAVAVRFYVRDPSTVLTPGSGPPLGTSTVALLAGETKEVLCVTPWIPAWVNNGHECVVCELSASADPGVFPPDAPWDLNDRHVAQRNFQLVTAVSASLFTFSHIVVLGLANDSMARVTIRPGSEKVFHQTLQSVGLEERVTKNVTGSCRFGLLANYRCHNQLPEDPTNSAEIQVKLERNNQAGATAVVRGPSEGWSEGSAGLFYIEQLDNKGSLIGGSAVMVARPTERINIGAIKSLESAAAPVRRIPASIPFRPYSTHATIALMNVDGIFVANHGNQYIAVEPRNDSPDILRDLEMYVEGASDPNIPITSSVIPVLRPVEPNATFKSQFLADFSKATPGQTTLSFIIQNAAAGSFIRVVKKIFVTRIEYDKNTKNFFIPFPQGMMEIHLNIGILPGKTDNRTGNEGQCKCCCACQCGAQVGGNQVSVSPAFIKAATITWTPSPPYAGVHGPLPFNDPWNKVGLGIIAGILALLGGTSLLIDYALSHSGGGGGGSETKVEVSVGGTFDLAEPSIHCCDKVEVSSSSNTILQLVASGLFAAAGYAATLAIGSDEVDFFYRGQEQTAPNQHELTVSEFVSFEADYAETPSLGTPFRGNVKWNYSRNLDSGRTLQYQAENAYSNRHYLSKYAIHIDGHTNPNNHFNHYRAIRRPLTICTEFFDPNGKPFVGNRLYVTCLIWTDTGRTRFYELRDDGIHGRFLNFDPNTGNYCTEIFTSLDDPAGTWYVFVFAQNVNTVLDGTDQYTAAKTIGGFVLTPQLGMDFDTNAKPCELNHDAVITVT